MAINLCTIASGSSGNSIYIGTKYTNILVDAGLSGISIQKGLKSINVEPSKINAIFITHEHSDHIKGAGILSRRFNIPLYATLKTWDIIEDKVGVQGNNKKIISVNTDCIIDDLCINAYRIPHDAVEPVGYTITDGKTKVSIATDIGHITNTVKKNIAGSNALVLEANHDVNMLECGGYPYYLKQRILGKLGHLSNDASGEFLSEIIDSKLKYVLLGHLSQENNFPELAFETVSSILKCKKINLKDLDIDVAPRYECSKFISI